MTSGEPIRYATSRDGTRIAWTAEGTGPSLIFVPPWNATIESQVWRWFTSGLFRGRIVTYDRRGFGRSDWGVEHGLEQYADDLEAVADAAGIAEITLYGAAAGTWESVVLAARTARVVRMILGEPPFRAREDGFTAQRSLFALLERDFATFWKAFLQFALGWGEKADIEALARHFISATNPVDIRSMWTALEGADLTPFAPFVQAECLIVHKADDPVMPPTAAADLARLIPNAGLLITSGGPRLARDETTRRHMERFLAGERTSTNSRAPHSRLPQPIAVGDGPRLSRREAQVLEYLSTGATNEEIAAALSLSRATVARHLANIYTKLDVRNRVEATAWALEQMPRLRVVGGRRVAGDTPGERERRSS